MKLKVINITGNNNIHRNEISINELTVPLVQKEESFINDRYYILSHIVNSNIEKFGLQDHKTNTFSSAKESFEKEEKSLVRLRFLIIDRKFNTIYYDGNRKDVENILKVLFNIERKSILNVVDPNELKKLTEIKISTSASGPMAFGDLHNPLKIISEFDDMFERNSIEKEIYTIKFKRKGTPFNFNAFEKLYKDTQTGLRILTVKGIDEKGHQVHLSSSISKKLSILEKRNSWADRNELKLKEVLQALREELENENN